METRPVDYDEREVAIGRLLVARRENATKNVPGTDYPSEFQAVDEYLGSLVAFSLDIEATLGREMPLMPQPVSSGPSPSSPENLPDRRISQRTLTIYRLVRIDSGGDRGFACCRDISNSGVRLELSMPLGRGHAVEVAFSPSNIIPGRVVWVEGNTCGIAFDTEVDSAAVLRRSAAELRRDRARPMRLDANMPARVSFDGANRATMVMDISQRGVKITHDGTFRRGLRVRVVLPSGAERDGIVRWAKSQMAGVYFIEPFSVEELGSISAL